MDGFEKYESAAARAAPEEKPVAATNEGKSLTDIVEQITHAGSSEAAVTVGEILESVGQSSFGPMLLVPGLVVLSPLSGIPGLPTLGAIIVLLIAGQLLLGRRCFWVPDFIRRRSISRERMVSAGRFLMPVARFMDRLVKPRLTFLTRKPFDYTIAIACVLLALVMPPLEAILFANSLTAAAISAYGLGLVASDGFLVLLASALTAASFWFLIAGVLL